MGNCHFNHIIIRYILVVTTLSTYACRMNERTEVQNPCRHSFIVIGKLRKKQYSCSASLLPAGPAAQFLLGARVRG